MSGIHPRFTHPNNKKTDKPNQKILKDFKLDYKT